MPGREATDADGTTVYGLDAHRAEKRPLPSRDAISPTMFDDRAELSETVLSWAELFALSLVPNTRPDRAPSPAHRWRHSPHGHGDTAGQGRWHG